MAGTSALAPPHRPATGAARAVAARRRGDPSRRRAELEARWRETLERVTALSVAYHEACAACSAGEIACSPGSARGRSRAGEASRDVSRLARRVVAERLALAEIEAALNRIAAGHYGRCEECRRPISAGRLAAQPEARFCPACGRHSAHLMAPVGPR